MKIVRWSKFYEGTLLSQCLSRNHVVESVGINLYTLAFGEASRIERETVWKCWKAFLVFLKF